MRRSATAVGRSCLTLLMGITCGLGVVRAQSSAPVAQAAASITAQDVARRIGLIAHDSMLGRDTPSRGLDLTARYVADQFRRFGLKPGGDSGSWLQHYHITRRRLDLSQSRVILSSGKGEDTLGFTRAARYEGGTVPEKPVTGPAVLVGGNHPPEAAAGLALEGRMVLVVPAPELGSDAVNELLRVLYLARPQALLVTGSGESDGFSGATARLASERTVIGPAPSRPAVIQIHAEAMARSLKAAGIDIAPISRSGRPVFRRLPELTIRLEMKDSVVSTVSAPNTVGILEGAHPELKHEYIVYSAHMDHIGVTPGRVDSINNGADDDASGTAGVIELAEAFSRPGARPGRSLIFLTVSGEEKGLWGSDYFARHPPVPIDRIVANLNMDMIGRNWPDTIVAIGKEHSDLGTILDRVNAEHRELGMTAIDDRWPHERFYFRSDHYNFARRGVPVLFFFNGVHPDYHEVTDSPDKINSEKEARILKLLFYLGQEIANAPQRPKWNPESYREIVEQ
jgi:hypothetical protein